LIERGNYDPSLLLAFKTAKLFDRIIEEIFAPDDVEETKFVRFCFSTITAVKMSLISLTESPQEHKTGNVLLIA